MSAESAFVRTWRVGKRSVTMTAPMQIVPGTVQCVSMEWDPDVPTRLSKKEMRQYEAGRDSAIADHIKQIEGGRVVVVDV